MKQFLLVFTIGLLVSASSFSASLLSTVDRQTVNEDETINLTITLDDASFSGNPDLDGLESNFQILSKRSSSSTTIVNGDYNSKKEWHYTLLPLKTGKLLIPSFKLKNIYSDAIEIEVISANSGASATQQGDIFLDLSLDKNNAYVQECITLTLQIFTAVNITRPEIPTPSLPGFMIEKISQAEYQSKRNGKNYYVLEYKYGLFPNKSGSTVLPQQRYQISQLIPNGSRSSFNIPGFNVPDTQTRMLSTREIPLTIKSPPEKMPAPYWLPSEDVVISDNWPEQQTVVVGQPLTRTIEIKATANLAAHLPPLTADDISGLKTYAEQPELTNTPANDNFQAIRKENIAIVPIQAGTYILPAIEIHWWDTKRNQFRTSTLPERTLTVQANTGVAPSPPAAQTPTASSMQDGPPASPDSTLNNSTADNAAAPFYMNVYIWMCAALFFVVLWIVTLAVMLSAKNKGAAENAIISASATSRQRSLKSTLKELTSACQANNATKVRSLLIDWAHFQWPDANILTLDQLKQQASNEQFSKLINELDAALYRGSAAWNGKPLLDFLLGTQFAADKASNVSLPALYE